MVSDLIFLVIILVVDFVISLWDSYASGYNIEYLREGKTPAGKLQYAFAYSGLGLGFSGMAYVMSFLISYIAYYFGYVSVTVVNEVSAYSFLVFGILIIGFGIMVTVQSIIIAYKRRSFWSILIAAWNTFAVVFDIVMYVTSFKEAVSVIRKSGRNSNNVYFIIIIAILIAFLMSYTAYKHGIKKAKSHIQTVWNNNQEVAV